MERSIRDSGIHICNHGNHVTLEQSYLVVNLPSFRLVFCYEKRMKTDFSQDKDKVDWLCNNRVITYELEGGKILICTKSADVKNTMRKT